MSISCKPEDFSYELPEELIAQQPLSERADSRLLVVPATAEGFRELCFSEVASLMSPGDLLVLNDTRVIPARLFGQKESGGKVEMLLERLLEPDLALVQLRSSRSPAEGSRLSFEGAEAVVEGRQDNFFRLRFEGPLEPVLEAHGHMPLPPYIDRNDVAEDRERYQTVFARKPGAVAAPTAGLHFTDSLLNDIRNRGINTVRITLHVGAGTFLPLREEQIRSGKLHSELVAVDDDVCAAVRATKAGGGRVIAVGTTVVRALEAAAQSGEIRELHDETDIFIQPGYQFRIVDAMITNFHLPESSLLMLVSAFAGKERILDAYRHAVEQKFRFFSYGDAMFLERAE